MKRGIHSLVGTSVSVALSIFSISVFGSQNAEWEALRKAARTEASSMETTPEVGEGFTSGAMSLQSLNPEISVTGDFLWTYKDVSSQESMEEFVYRGLGLHVESYLDPYTKFKAAASFNEDGVGLGEAYMTRFGWLPNLSVTLGKFRQQFGVVNRWHKHGLDQVDFPLALRMIFGEAGLNQTGVSVDWVAPGMIGFSNEVTLQMTDGQNVRVFGENENKRSSGLIHYKLYRDLSESTYAEIGVSGLFGRNNEWEVLGSVEQKSLGASVYGVDLSFLWEPSDRMRYRNVTWRSEAYFLNKNILAPDGSGEDEIKAWGGYSYLESRVSRTVFLGVRGDYFVPDIKPYADAGTVSLSPLAVTETDSFRWQVGPYLTWHQSPFVHYRVEFNHQDGDGMGPKQHQFWVQCIFAAGPHKHERY